MEPTRQQRKHRRHPVNFLGVYSSGPVQVREAIVLDLSIGRVPGGKHDSHTPRFSDSFSESASSHPSHLCPQRDRALGKWLRIRCAVPRIA